jgi:hypothetical protein
VTPGDEGDTLGVAAGDAAGGGVVTTGGGLMRCGIIRFGPSCGAGARGASLVSGVTVGVGNTVRAGGVTRRTGVKVGNGFDADSVTSEGVAVGSGVVTAGAGVRRGGSGRFGTSRGTDGGAASLVSGDTVGVGKTLRGGGVTGGSEGFAIGVGVTRN